MAVMQETRADHLERLIIRTPSGAFFLPATEIDWIEAEGNYVKLHAGGRTHLFRQAFATLEARLDPRRFRRIHRSTMVNLDSIRELRPGFHGSYEVVLRDGTKLKLSQRHRGNLEAGSIGRL